MTATTQTKPTEPEMLPAVQLQDDGLLQRAMTQLGQSDIQARFSPLSDLAQADVPAWVKPELGGWVLFIERPHFEEGMKLLSVLTGFEPHAEGGT